MMTTEELAQQPAAYWTGMAYEALIAFTRARMAEAGITQPQFWLLRNLSVNDLSADGAGKTVAELRDAMVTYLRAGDDLDAESAAAVAQGWLTRDDDGRLWLTESGEATRLRIKEITPAVRGRIHDGIDDADYVTALRVLQRMIRNVS